MVCKQNVIMFLFLLSGYLNAQTGNPENPRGSVAIIGSSTTIEEHAGDMALRDKLWQMNFAVDYYRDGDMEGGSVPRDTSENHDLIIVSESASSSKLRMLLRWEFSTPTINMEAASVQNTHHKLELISTVIGGNGWLKLADENANKIKILDGTHPLAAGFKTGQVLDAITHPDSFKMQYPFGEGIIGYIADEIGVIPIASFNTLQGDTALVICGIEVGTTNIHGDRFNARYVQFNLYSTTMTRWTTSTDSLFAAAIEWVLDKSTALEDKNGGQQLQDFQLSQNYPNPFNPSTEINFYLPKSEHVVIDVFNTLGQKMETLVNNEFNSGRHSIIFNAANLSSGIYYYRIQAGQFRSIKKMVLAR
ncbi:MAG: T9SS type A sorting domain-containing protein [Calditrichales bacterium]|nr:MAG: T9SS type A sorting domain-containing protein [Calditrichales bacterium]